MSAPTLFIAGGGTGGHVFPAVAVAEAVAELADVEVVFCGTRRGLEARLVPARGWRLEVLRVEPMRGGGAKRAMRGALVAMRATQQALSLLRSLRPRAVLSVGGYASGPVTLAAALTGVPVALLEPNCVVGLTNRILTPFARRAYVAWEAAALRFPERARRLYGVPLRGGFAPKPMAERAIPRVLVMGGSQGAEALNDRMPRALAMVLRAQRVEVVHQSGPHHQRQVEATYAQLGIDRVKVSPFLEDVAAAIADADVVVARAGAGTIAEISAVGRPAILIPFPSAADDHQRRNADSLAATGGAVCIPQAAADPEALAGALERLLVDRALRCTMAKAARGHGRPNAAHDVAVDLLGLARIEHRSGGRAAHGTTPPLRAHERS